MKKHLQLIEALEARIAPAAVFTFTDVDGDLVRITSSKGVDFDLENAAHVVGGQLQSLDLSSSSFGAEFAGADISFSAVPQAGKGDGHVNVGFINATGTDLGKVAIPGDLGRIVAGNLGELVPAVKSLNVASIGALGLNTQAAGGTLISVVEGNVGTLTVLGEIHDAKIRVGSTTDSNLGSASIGGDLNGGELTVTGNAGSIKIGGGLLAGPEAFTGQITVGDNLGSLIVAGSIHGGDDGGEINVGGKAGSIKIGGDLLGGSGAGTASIRLSGPVGSLSIGGSVHGGLGSSSGSIIAQETLGKLTIGGNLEGGFKGFSGAIELDGKTGSVVIGGSLIGGGDDDAGSFLAQKVATFVVKGSLLAGVASNTANIKIDDAGAIKIGGDLNSLGQTHASSESASVVTHKLGSITVGGSLLVNNPFLGTEHNSSILSQTTIGSVNIGGSVKGVSTCRPVISAADSIGTINIGGVVDEAQILAGYNSSGVAVNADAKIGAVKVGAWHASDLVAGVSAGNDGNFGSPDDFASGARNDPRIISKIASLTVRGQALGDRPSGIVAQQIGAIKVGNLSLGFTAATKDVFHLGLIGDLVAREVA